MNENKFYYQGEFFPSFEKMLEYSYQWNKMRLDETSALRNFDTFQKSFISTVLYTNLNVTNAEYCKILDDMLLYGANRLAEVTSQKSKV